MYRVPGPRVLLKTEASPREDTQNICHKSSRTMVIYGLKNIYIHVYIKEQTIVKLLNGNYREGKRKVLGIPVAPKSKTNTLDSEDRFQVSMKKNLLTTTAINRCC